MVDNLEYGLWDVHFLGDYQDSSTAIVLQVPSNTEDFQKTYLSIVPYQGHSPSQQNDASVWQPVDSTPWVSDGTSLSRDFLLQSVDTKEYIGPIPWNPTTQKEKNGATLWTCTLLNMDVQVSSDGKRSTSLYGYLQLPPGGDFNYVIYDNANGRYTPRLGSLDLQNTWIFHVTPKQDVVTKDQWVLEMQVPSSARVDHFPTWFISSYGKGIGNDAHASKNRHAPCMDSQSNPNTKWTVHVIGIASKTEMETTYLVHLESNNHYFLSSAPDAKWRPSLTTDHQSDAILMNLVILNGAVLQF